MDQHSLGYFQFFSLSFLFSCPIYLFPFLLFCSIRFSVESFATVHFSGLVVEPLRNSVSLWIFRRVHVLQGEKKIKGWEKIKYKNYKYYWLLTFTTLTDWSLVRFLRKSVCILFDFVSAFITFLMYSKSNWIQKLIFFLFPLTNDWITLVF